MSRIAVVVGARPNFVKAAPLIRELAKDHFPVHIIHTGQHWTDDMSGSFFSSLIEGEFATHKQRYSPPGPSRRTRMTWMIDHVGGCLDGLKVDLCVVVGDVDGTLAGAIAAYTCGVPIVHLESGLRSHDMTMPEEMNRILVDRMSDLLLITEPSGVMNLAGEGHSGRTVVVGNTMIDSLLSVEMEDITAKYDVIPGDFILATFHRKALVSDASAMKELLEALRKISLMVPVVFPVHPSFKAAAGDLLPKSIIQTGPMEYLDFVRLMNDAKIVLTDSGGVQEESSALGVECITYRDTTERPITVSHGTNRVIGMRPNKLIHYALEARGRRHKCEIPMWDGHAAERAAVAIGEYLENPGHR